MSTTARLLLLHGDLAELERLAVWIEGWAMGDLSANLSFAVQVCLEEAVVDIIMYSPTTDDRLEIVIEIERRGQTVVARIEDNGDQACKWRRIATPGPSSSRRGQTALFGSSV